MDTGKIDRAVELLRAGRLDGVRMDGLPPELRPPDEAAAYALQQALHARLEHAGHGRVAGHKIGCTTPVMQEYLGIHNPCAGGVFDSTAHEGSAALPYGGYRHAGVECEIAVRLGTDLPTGDAPFSRESVLPAVESVMAAIEVVDDRWADYGSVDTPTLIADDFFGAGCVLATGAGEMADPSHLDLAAVAGSMTINGECVGRGTGRDIMGHPLEALAWLANCMAERGAALKRGEFVLLGSIVQTKWVNAGDLVEIEIESLGHASVRFV